MHLLKSLPSTFLRFSLKKKIATAIVIFIVVFGAFRIFGARAEQPQYQTATVEKGTLIVSVSASGVVSAANSTPINTQMSGVVKTLFVTNGDTVKAGDKIAEIDLDLPSQQKQSQAYASYLQAKSSLDSANANLHSLQSKMYSAWQAYMNTATDTTYQNSDGTPNTNNRVQTEYTIPEADWQAAQDQFKNQQAVITGAQSALSSAWLSYQQSSSVVVAPMSGMVQGLAIQEGSILVPQSNSTSTTTTTNSQSSGQKIATIQTEGNPLISVSLSQIDAPKVHVGQRATITFDAFADKTFTGKVFSLDTMGVVSSGVTTYTVIIALDTPSSTILPNMSASATIITQTKDNAILVPSAAIQTQDGQSSARILSKNGTPTQVAVTVGDSSDTQTEVLTGLSEGDAVVTGTVQKTGTTTQPGTSPFSGTRGFGGGGTTTGGTFRASGR